MRTLDLSTKRKRCLPLAHQGNHNLKFSKEKWVLNETIGPIEFISFWSSYLTLNDLFDFFYRLRDFILKWIEFGERCFIELKKKWWQWWDSNPCKNVPLSWLGCCCKGCSVCFMAEKRTCAATFRPRRELRPTKVQCSKNIFLNVNFGFFQWKLTFWIRKTSPT